MHQVISVAIDDTFIKSYLTCVKHTNHKQHIVKHYLILKSSMKTKINESSTATFGIIKHSIHTRSQIDQAHYIIRCA